MFDDTNEEFIRQILEAQQEVRDGKAMSGDLDELAELIDKTK